MNTEVAVEESSTAVVDPGFEPRAVYLQKIAPLFNTFDKTESEAAAAILVVTMAARDSWEAVSLMQCAAEFKAFAMRDLEARWPMNPFFRPNFHRLVDDGFAEWVGHDDGFLLRFTELGHERLRKWVQWVNS